MQGYSAKKTGALWCNRTQKRVLYYDSSGPRVSPTAMLSVADHNTLHGRVQRCFNADKVRLGDASFGILCCHCSSVSLVIAAAGDATRQAGGSGPVDARCNQRRNWFGHEPLHRYPPGVS